MGRRNTRVRFDDRGQLGLDLFLTFAASLNYVRLFAEKRQSAFAGANIAMPDASTSLADGLVHVHVLTALHLVHILTITGLSPWFCGFFEMV